MIAAEHTQQAHVGSWRFILNSRSRFTCRTPDIQRRWTHASTRSSLIEPARSRSPPIDGAHRFSRACALALTDMIRQGYWQFILDTKAASVAPTSEVCDAIATAYRTLALCYGIRTLDRPRHRPTPLNVRNEYGQG